MRKQRGRTTGKRDHIRKGEDITKGKDVTKGKDIFQGIGGRDHDFFDTNLSFILTIRCLVAR